MNRRLTRWTIADATRFRVYRKCPSRLLEKA